MLLCRSRSSMDVAQYIVPPPPLFSVPTPEAHCTSAKLLCVLDRSADRCDPVARNRTLFTGAVPDVGGEAAGSSRSFLLAA